MTAIIIIIIIIIIIKTNSQQLHHPVPLGFLQKELQRGGVEPFFKYIII
jgi:hypothetical protein